MGVSRKEVEHIAKLANLFLKPEEMTSTHRELEKILGLVADLSDAAEGMLPLSVEKESGTPERSDIVQSSLNIEQFISQAPASVGSAFQVPRIIEQDH